MDYQISSRDYLARARTRLSDNTQEALFYAALELRCGIEARYQEYLGAWDHIAEKKKSGWKIANLAKDVEGAFKTGNKIAEIRIYDKNIVNEALLIFYFTPVTSDLKRGVERRLNDCLHTMKRLRKSEDTFWKKLRKDLEKIAGQLELANRGTLLGPPLMRADGKKIDMNCEIPETKLDHRDKMKDFMSKNDLLLKVSYLQNFPIIIEKNAVIWTPPER